MIRLAVVVGPAETPYLAQHDLGYHLAEAPLLAQYPEMLAFYKDQVDRGAHVVLDNGVALGKYTDEGLLHVIADRIHATEVVMPDVQGDMGKTLEKWQDAERWVKIKRRFGVPHGSTVKEWMCCLSFMLKWGVRTIGIAKMYEEKFPGGRAEILRVLEDFADDIDIHMLGLWMDFRSAREEVASWQGYHHLIRGLDTSAPTAYAQAGAHLQDFRTKIHLSTEVIPATDPELFHANVMYLQEVLRNAY